MSSTAIYATPIRRSTVEKALIYMVRQYWRECGQPDKYKIFARWTSFHGNTTGALHWGDNTGRRRHYQPLFLRTPHNDPAPTAVAVCSTKILKDAT